MQSCPTIGSVLREMDSQAEAARAFAEGLQQITPFFLRLPQAFEGLTTTLLEDYLAACRAAGQAPDEALIRPIQEALVD